MKKNLRWLPPLLLTLLCSVGLLLPSFARSETTEFEKQCFQIIKKKGNVPESARLNEFFDLDWKYQINEYPELDPAKGDNSRWTDLSLESIERRKHELRSELRVLGNIDRGQLKPNEQVFYDIYENRMLSDVRMTKFPTEYLQISPLGGVYDQAAATFDVMPTQNLKDFEDRLARLRAYPKVIAQVKTLLKKGIEHHVMPPKVVMERLPDRIAAQLEKDPKKSPILTSFNSMPSSISSEQKKRIWNEASVVLEKEVLPALDDFYKFFVHTYLPACTKTIAFKDLPNGKAWYSELVATMTTTNLSAKKIHQIGLDEVKRIRGEMKQVIRKLGSQESLRDFVQKLKKDSKFYFSKKEELVKGYKSIEKHVKAKLPHFFKQLPETELEVRPVPEYAEQTQVAAYYMGGSLEKKLPGVFFVNTYKPEIRPKWEMEALFLHEGLPGHHLQISTAKELKDVPEMLKYSFFGAYIEGWGLYSESLGKEMGIYGTDYDYFGRLNFELWRAIRLVVDTGIHDLGWSREKAMEFFRENSATSEENINVEVNRYIIMPGQALTYKIGELKILELRHYAEEKLKDKFKMSEFHDIVLRNGALPLTILERQVKEWVERASQT